MAGDSDGYGDISAVVGCAMVERESHHNGSWVLVAGWNAEKLLINTAATISRQPLLFKVITHHAV